MSSKICVKLHKKSTKTTPSEWHCFEHTGYALQKACQWWSDTVGGSVPFSVDDAIETLNNTPHKMPRQLLCTKEASSRYWQITSKTNFYDSVPTLPLPKPPKIVSDDDIPF